MPWRLCSTQPPQELDELRGKFPPDSRACEIANFPSVRVHDFMLDQKFCSWSQIATPCLRCSINRYQTIFCRRSVLGDLAKSTHPWLTRNIMQCSTRSTTTRHAVYIGFVFMLPACRFRNLEPFWFEMAIMCTFLPRIAVLLQPVVRWLHFNE